MCLELFLNKRLNKNHQWLHWIFLKAPVSLFASLYRMRQHQAFYHQKLFLMKRTRESTISAAPASAASAISFSVVSQFLKTSARTAFICIAAIFIKYLLTSMPLQASYFTVGYESTIKIVTKSTLCIGQRPKAWQLSLLQNPSQIYFEFLFQMDMLLYRNKLCSIKIKF